MQDYQNIINKCFKKCKQMVDHMFALLHINTFWFLLSSLQTKKKREKKKKT